MNSPTTPPAKAHLRRVMRGTEYFTLAFGSIVGVGWMVVLEQWFRRGGPAGAMLGFLLGGVALVPVVYVYGRLAERIPEAASEVAYTGAVFPRSVSFATGWAMTLTYVMVCPWETVAMCKIAAYSFPQLKTIELYQVGGYHVYLPYLLVGLGTVAVITFIKKIWFARWMSPGTRPDAEPAGAVCGSPRPPDGTPRFLSGPFIPVTNLSSQVHIELRLACSQSIGQQFRVSGQNSQAFRTSGLSSVDRCAVSVGCYLITVMR